MNSWDFGAKFLDTLKTAPGAVMFTLCVVVILGVYTLTVGGLLYLNMEGPKQIVLELREMRQDLQVLIRDRIAQK